MFKTTFNVYTILHYSYVKSCKQQCLLWKRETERVYNFVCCKGSRLHIIILSCKEVEIINPKSFCF